MTAGNPMEVVSSLLEERQRFEGWIATLEGRRASTPPHVYARVHADYERRLEEVLERLGSRTGELQEAVGDLRGRIDRLQEEENARRDERAEAELRAMVGEYTPEEWEAKRGESDAEINRLSAESAGLRDELARIEELLRTATAPKRSGENAAVEAPAQAASPAAPAVPMAASHADAGMAAAGSGPASAPPPVSSPERAFAGSPDDHLAPVSAFAPNPPDRPAMRPTVDNVRNADVGGAPNESRGFDELAFLNSVVDSRNSRQVPGASQGAQGAPAPSSRPIVEPPTNPANRTTVPGRRMPTPADAFPSAPNAADDVRIGASPRDTGSSFVRDVPAEQAKTLKCQECGTMNYPTEWYCERCGGELAAM